MRSFRRGDPKYFDCGINDAVTTAGTTWADTEVACDNFVDANGAVSAYTGSCLVPTANGGSYGQVDGTSYLLNKFRIRGRIQRLTAASDQADTLPPLIVRALLVMDLMPGGVQAQGEDVIQDFGATAENTFAFQRVAATAGKFRVLKDETWQLPVVTGSDNAAVGPFTTSQNNGLALFNWKWEPKEPLKVHIKAGTGTTPIVAGAINCNIFMLVYGMQNGSAVTLSVGACSRAYYTD